MALFASLAGIAAARLRRAVRRARLRAGLIGLAVLFALLGLGFGLLAATAALAHEIGLVPALLVMAGGALFALIVVLVVLAVEARRARRLAARRETLDREFARAALLSAASSAGRLARDGRARWWRSARRCAAASDCQPPAIRCRRLGAAAVNGLLCCASRQV